VIWAAITRHGIVWPRGSSPVRGVARDDANQQSRDIRAADADVDAGQPIAAQLPQVLLSCDASHGSQVRSCPASRRAAISTSAAVRTLTTTAWARAALDDHRDGQAVVRTGGSPPASGPVGGRPGSGGWCRLRLANHDPGVR
jgi:hypothetical protein